MIRHMLLKVMNNVSHLKSVLDSQFASLVKYNRYWKRFETSLQLRGSLSIEGWTLGSMPSMDPPLPF